MKVIMVQSRKKLDADLRIVGIVHVQGRFPRSPVHISLIKVIKPFNYMYLYGAKHI